MVDRATPECKDCPYKNIFDEENKKIKELQLEYLEKIKKVNEVLAKYTRKLEELDK